NGENIDSRQGLGFPYRFKLVIIAPSLCHGKCERWMTNLLFFTILGEPAQIIATTFVPAIPSKNDKNAPSLRHGKVTIWRGPAESCKKMAPASRRTWKEAFFNDKVCASENKLGARHDLTCERAYSGRRWQRSCLREYEQGEYMDILKGKLTGTVRYCAIR
ncbi:Hypothetical predicted protein, partial [Paramuricea clavata]